MSLKDIRQRLEAATPGPWKAMQGDFQAEGGTYDAFGVDPVLVLSTVYEEVAGCYLIVEPPEEADAEFIAYARQDVPALLEYVAELEAKLDKFKLCEDHYGPIMPCGGEACYHIEDPDDD